MQQFWKTYMVPITVSGIGLFLALILGLVPLIGQSEDTAPQQAALSATAKLTNAMEEIRVRNAAEIAELKKIVSAQAKTISGFENRLKNLDRGVKNTFFRSKKNKDLIGAMVDTTQRLSNLEVQMTTVNRAVENTFHRSKKNKDLIGTMAGTTQRLSNLEVQMTTLNRAVPRISGRIKALQNATQ